MACARLREALLRSWRQSCASLYLLSVLKCGGRQFSTSRERELRCSVRITELVEISWCWWWCAQFLCCSDPHAWLHRACDAARLVSSRFVLHVVSTAFFSSALLVSLYSVILHRTRHHDISLVQKSPVELDLVDSIVGLTAYAALRHQDRWLRRSCSRKRRTL